MGLIKALTQSVGSVMADQWLEFFTCDALPENVVIKRGRKQTKGNNKGSESVISNGSGIAVNNGQAMAIVDNGKVIEFTAEPGVFTYQQGTEPSVFSGSFGDGLMQSIKKIGQRFAKGGDIGNDQRVYYFNLKELTGYKFGTSEPIVYDDPKYQSIGVRCFGTVSLALTDPIVFFEHVAGNVTDEYRLDKLWEEQLKQEFVTFLGQSLAMLSNDGVRFSQMPQHQVKLVKYMNDVMDMDWNQARGLTIRSTGIPSITLDPKFQDKVNKYDDIHMMSNPTNAAANLASAQADAMRTAAGNKNGAMMGFMGMNMANQAGGMNSQQLFQMGQQQAPPTQPGSDNWTCACGNVNSGNFCENCGKAKSKAKFCPSCGKPVTGKFCQECGAKTE